MTAAVQAPTRAPKDTLPVVLEIEKAAPPAETTPAPAPVAEITPAPAPILEPVATTIPEPVTPIPNPELAAEEEKTGKKFTHFITAKPDCKPAAPATFQADQESKYEELLKYAQGIDSVPVSTEKGAESRPLDDEEKMWLTKECLLRYLRASKWNVADAKKRLDGTLIWRREYGVRDHTADYISPEMETGKMYTLGFDNEARPCIYLNPGRQNTERSPRQVHALVFMLERVIDIMGPGQGTLALLIDFKSATSSTSPSVGQGRQVLNILQMHYPERLGKALIINSRLSVMEVSSLYA